MEADENNELGRNHGPEILRIFGPQANFFILNC